MSATHHARDVDVEEKQVYDATIHDVKDVPSDGASSIDTITALVNEGIPHHPSNPIPLTFLSTIYQSPSLIPKLTCPLHRPHPRNPTTHNVLAKSRLAPLRRPSLPGHNGTILVSIRPRLGPRHNHHAHFRHPVLHHLPHHAQIHHEEPSNQGYLRLRLPRFRQIQDRLRVYRIHVAGE